MKTETLEEFLLRGGIVKLGETLYAKGFFKWKPLKSGGSRGTRAGSGKKPKKRKRVHGYSIWGTR